MCDLTRLRSAEVAAGAGAATAISASGAKARAKLFAKFISKLLGVCAANWRFPFECPLNSQVPKRSGSDRVPVGVDQHFAAADVIWLANEALFLHSFDQPRGTVVADTQLPLQVGCRSLLAFGD